MSIALTAKVEALEKRVAELEVSRHNMQYVFAEFRKRLDDLEQTAQRKPGPKPKESNG
jgi:prefoldin subunit 5